MPSPATSLHVASLDYACTFGQLPADGGLVSFSCPDPVHFTFGFETGKTEVSAGVYQITTDYSWFDQATVEADISGALSQIVAAVAELLGLPLAEVDQAVTVRRVWTFAPNMQGAGVSSGRVVSTDLMQYPPLVTGADSAAEAEASSSSATVPGADAASGAESASVALRLPGCLPGCLWPGWVWPFPGRLPGCLSTWPGGAPGHGAHAGSL